jgi:AmiR/NasT family two-component response regulator
VGHADRLRSPTIERAPHGGGRVTLGHALYAHARVEMAIGVLMELSGWDAITARSHLLRAAVRVDASVEHVAEIILALGPELPAR